MPQYFINTTLAAGTTVHITGDDFHHLARVRRVKPGDPVSLRDAGGALFSGWVAEIAQHEILVDVSASLGAGSALPRLTLAMALLKNKNFELVVQKCVEVGVSCIVPLMTERTIPDIGGREDRKVERWQAIAHEAAKQSMRADLPSVEQPVHFKDFVARSHEGLRICAHPSDNGETLRRAAASSSAHDAVVLIGPEGGFSPAEIALAEKHGFINVNIGCTQMRAETAGIVLPALVLYELMEAEK